MPAYRTRTMEQIPGHQGYAEKLCLGSRGEVKQPRLALNSKILLPQPPKQLGRCHHSHQEANLVTFSVSLTPRPVLIYPTVLDVFLHENSMSSGAIPLSYLFISEKLVLLIFFFCMCIMSLYTVSMFMYTWPHVPLSSMNLMNLPVSTCSSGVTDAHCHLRFLHVCYKPRLRHFINGVICPAPAHLYV